MSWNRKLQLSIFKKVPLPLLILVLLFSCVSSFVGWMIIDDDVVQAIVPSKNVQASDFVEPDVSTNVINISFLGQDQTELFLSDFRGKIVLLYLWTSWCKNYEKDLIALNHLQQKIGMRKFVVIPVSLDQFQMRKIRQIYDRHEIDNLNLYQDPNGRSLVDLGQIKKLPLTIFIDPNGKEIARFDGKIFNNKRKIAAFTREQIKQLNKDAQEFQRP